MITGRKAGRPQEATRSAWRSVAAIVLAAVLRFWAIQWQAAPGGDGSASALSRQEAAGTTTATTIERG
jgi:hypothetical protein